MNDNTFIKLYRSLLNWRWYKDGNTVRVFIHLLMKANITAADFEEITIQRGEVVTSYNSLAGELGLSTKNIRTALKHLKSTGEVASRSTSKFTIITINNYEKYQGVASKTASEWQASGKQAASEWQQYNKNNKKKKNIYSARTREGEKNKFVRSSSYDINELMRIK